MGGSVLGVLLMPELPVTDTGWASAAVAAQDLDRLDGEHAAPFQRRLRRETGVLHRPAAVVLLQPREPVEIGSHRVRVEQSTGRAARIRGEVEWPHVLIGGTARHMHPP